MDGLKTVGSSKSAEITEKKSKFIANIFYVENEKEAEEILKKIKKKYFDAKHNCYAYRILDGENIIQRSSDDGEPSGTAGKPMLTILEKNNFVNCIVIVTRYFGGILLGTGGLVKAYSDVTIQCLNNSEIMNIELGYEVNLQLNYQDLEKIKYFCKINNIKIQEENFSEKIELILNIQKNKIQALSEFCSKNLNNSKCNIKKEKNIIY